MQKQINPSVLRIIEAFKKEIEAQKISHKIGIKYAGDMAGTLQENLKDFAREYDLDLCEACGEYCEDCMPTNEHESECPDCRADYEAMEDTYKMLRQVR